MKNYKVILIISSLIALSTILAVTYIELPAPQSVKIKILDVNDNAVK